MVNVLTLGAFHIANSLDFLTTPIAIGRHCRDEERSSERRRGAATGCVDGGGAHSSGPATSDSVEMVGRSEVRSR